MNTVWRQKCLKLTYASCSGIETVLYKLFHGCLKGDNDLVWGNLVYRRGGKSSNRWHRLYLGLLVDADERDKLSRMPSCRGLSPRSRSCDWTRLLSFLLKKNYNSPHRVRFMIPISCSLLRTTIIWSMRRWDDCRALTPSLYFALSICADRHACITTKPWTWGWRE